jgi:hypothetical protein
MRRRTVSERTWLEKRPKDGLKSTWMRMRIAAPRRRIAARALAFGRRTSVTVPAALFAGAQGHLGLVAVVRSLTATGGGWQRRAACLNR